MNKIQFTLGGTAWINLVNTRYLSNEKEVDILLESSKTFKWLEENHLLREYDVKVLEDKEWLNLLTNELISLRDLCKMILSDLKQQEKLSVTTIEQLSRMVQEINVNLAVIPTKEKIKLVSEGKTTRDHVLYNIVYSITHTLNSISNERIRECEHQDCIHYFVDTSKPGKRRWCSMELCGNRQKAAEFYARKKNKK
ncbi:CGNR zinc finger domain-containing protein [Gracilibacillus kekensis]|uniref:Conserved protein containing a Zn-ribbon-like motif, possibly RNA-binding n=1 Tax=Gracilibacillus kekensis TaxID=1027249 RepID=A0A1M7Q7C0_9BACI|nr:CGNR zinc finger domain-containing protein [Gracilibacillus kekensis]SHN26271.1 Conserved protein containing a Zn-ribbon-like motif, possibly RNA-binding [Gracilibacillus kekensis]